MKLLASAVVAALALAGSALAASPPKAHPTTQTTEHSTTTRSTTTHSTVACRNRIINQWEGTGKIATTFAPDCYRSALKYLEGRTDLKTYSSLGDDIRLALQASQQRAEGKKVPLSVGKHYGKTPQSQQVGFTTSTIAVPTKSPPKGAAREVADAASGTPLPILILGGVALALIAAGAIGTGVRYTRRRR